MKNEIIHNGVTKMVEGRNGLYSNPTIGFVKKCIKEDGAFIAWHFCGKEETILDLNLLNALIRKTNKIIVANGVFGELEDDDLLEELF